MSTDRLCIMDLPGVQWGPISGLGLGNPLAAYLHRAHERGRNVSLSQNIASAGLIISQASAFSKQGTVAKLRYSAGCVWKHQHWQQAAPSTHRCLGNGCSKQPSTSNALRPKAHLGRRKMCQAQEGQTQGGEGPCACLKGIVQRS